MLAMASPYLYSICTAAALRVLQVARGGVCPARRAQRLWHLCDVHLAAGKTVRTGRTSPGGGRRPCWHVWGTMVFGGW